VYADLERCPFGFGYPAHRRSAAGSGWASGAGVPPAEGVSQGTSALGPAGKVGGGSAASAGQVSLHARAGGAGWRGDGKANLPAALGAGGGRTDARTTGSSAPPEPAQPS